MVRESERDVYISPPGQGHDEGVVRSVKAECCQTGRRPQAESAESVFHRNRPHVGCLWKEIVAKNTPEDIEQKVRFLNTK